MKIDQCRIVLTGAASGLGRALLHQLAVYPAHIVAADLNREGLEAVIASSPAATAAITPYLCDLSQQAGIDGLFDEALRRLGGIDLFIANAGFAYYEHIDTPDWAHIAHIFQVNVFAAMYAAEKMRVLNVGRRFRVVITASAMSHLALPGYAIYAATKAALDRFAEGYRFELEQPSDLTLVYPIGTRTNFFNAAGSDVPLPWPTQTPETVAHAVIRGIEHDRPAIYPSRLFRLFMVLRGVLPFLGNLVQSQDKRRFEQWLAAKNQTG
jgi:short-subunit dehydrogenase